MIFEYYWYHEPSGKSGKSVWDTDYLPKEYVDPSFPPHKETLARLYIDKWNRVLPELWFYSLKPIAEAMLDRMTE